MTLLVIFLALFKNHMSLVTCDMSRFMCRMWHVTFHLSHVNFHLSLMPAATDLPLLTPPLSKVDWFQFQKNLINHGQLYNGDVLLDLESLEPYLPTLFYTEKKYFGCYRPLQILWHTYGHGDYMTDPAQRAKLVKIQPPSSSCFDIRAIFILWSFWTNAICTHVIIFLISVCVRDAPEWPTHRLTDQTILGQTAARPGLIHQTSPIPKE